MKVLVITVLEAHVAPEQWDALKEAYQAGAANLPPQMVETFLLQSAKDPTLWQGVSVWKSRAALDEYRQSTQTPGGVLIFRAAGAEPTLTIFDVASHMAHQS